MSKKMCRSLLFCLTLMLAVQPSGLVAGQDQRTYWQTFLRYAPWITLGSALGYGIGPQLGYDPRLSAAIGFLLGGSFGGRLTDIIEPASEGVEEFARQDPSHWLESTLAGAVSTEPEQVQKEAQEEVNRIVKGSIRAQIALKPIGFFSERKALSVDKTKVTIRASTYDFFYMSDFQSKPLSITKWVENYENRLIDQATIQSFNHVLIYSLLKEGKFNVLPFSFNYKQPKFKKTIVIVPDIEGAKNHFLLAFFHAYKKPMPKVDEIIRKQILNNTKNIKEKVTIVLRYLKIRNRFDDPIIFTFN